MRGASSWGPMIRRLAFISRPRPGLALAEIPRIVASGRRRNEGAGITGVFLFTGLDFVQLIEGAPPQVTDLWSRIRVDVLHEEINVLFDERAPSRWFADWRVGFPSDGVAVGRIASWRQQGGVWDDTKRAELRQLLAAIDTM
jgi:hypothetical protein